MLGLVTAAALAATPSRAGNDRATAEITRAEDAWRQARITADMPFLERFYAREMRIQGMDGKVQSRAADLALFSGGVIKPEIIAHGPLDIAVYGQTAVVTGLDHIVGSYGGRHGDLWLRFTDVLVHRNGRWQLVVQQATPSAPE